MLSEFEMDAEKNVSKEKGDRDWRQKVNYAVWGSAKKVRGVGGKVF